MNVDYGEKYVRASLGGKVKRPLGDLSFVREAVAVYYCARDRKTPFRFRAVFLMALAYFVMPVDGIPDFIAALGFTDDAAVFWAAYRFIVPHFNDVPWCKAVTYLGAREPPSNAQMPN